MDRGGGVGNIRVGGGGGIIIELPVSIPLIKYLKSVKLTKNG